MQTTTENAEKKLKIIVDKIHNLPTPPIVFTQITKVINNPDTSAYEIGGIIAEDPALTAKVLKLTNSSFYGIPRTITNVKQAIVILGLDAIKSLVISASVFEAFSKNKTLDTEYLETFWRHSLSVAFMAKIITRSANASNLQEAEIAFSAGLLHDIGKLIIVSHLQDEHLKIKSVQLEKPTIPEINIESAVLEFTHADLGSYMAGKWNLPEEICGAILNHHTEDKMSTDQMSAVIHLSDFLVHKNEQSDEDETEYRNPFYEKVWTVLGIDESKTEQMLELLKGEYAKAETFMNMAQGVSSQ